MCIPHCSCAHPLLCILLPAHFPCNSTACHHCIGAPSGAAWTIHDTTPSDLFLIKSKQATMPNVKRATGVKHVLGNCPARPPCPFGTFVHETKCDEQSSTIPTGCTGLGGNKAGIPCIFWWSKRESRSFSRLRRHGKRGPRYVEDGEMGIPFNSANGHTDRLNQSRLRALEIQGPPISPASHPPRIRTVRGSSRVLYEAPRHTPIRPVPKIVAAPMSCTPL
jgi:hypothetical protein